MYYCDNCFKFLGQRKIKIHTAKIFPSNNAISNLMISCSNGLKFCSVNPNLAGLWCTDFNILRKTSK